MKIKLFLIIIILSVHCLIAESDNTHDTTSLLYQIEFPDDVLNKPPVVVRFGGNVILKSRILMGNNSQYFTLLSNGMGFEPSPNDKWFAGTGGEFWTRFTFLQDRFLHFKISSMFKFDGDGIVPLFNIDELYLSWKYDNGNIRIGRSQFALTNPLIFHGPLDGIDLLISAPYLDFTTFLGYTGFLGVFHPYYNPYAITDYDRSFEELTNLASSTMTVQLNAEQARRIFFGLNFDINFFGQHIIPYLLLQFDISSIPINDFGNTDYTVNTFHMGVHTQGKIYTNLYYKLHFSGLFGTHFDVTNNLYKPILSFALESELQYSIPKAGHSTFFLNYSLGFGTNNHSSSFWDDSSSTIINKFYYFGSFNGGYVLSPVLSNIQILSVKYQVTPVKVTKAKLSIYTTFYQTFKIYPDSTISDDNCDLSSRVVGSEIDLGFLLTFARYVSLGIDTGLFIPELAYTDRTVRLRMGASMTISF
ncbi:MAG: alginate export family protein [Spirochaetes bacterium]|nr:alginate export family protein [Spirochaetota bacterium]